MLFGEAMELLLTSLHFENMYLLPEKSFLMFTGFLGPYSFMFYFLLKISFCFVENFHNVFFCPFFLKKTLLKKYLIQNSYVNFDTTDLRDGHLLNLQYFVLAEPVQRNPPSRLVHGPCGFHGDTVTQHRGGAAGEVAHPEEELVK